MQPFISVYVFFSSKVTLSHLASPVSPTLESTSSACPSASGICVWCMQQHSSGGCWPRLARDLAGASSATPRSCCAAARGGT